MPTVKVKCTVLEIQSFEYFLWHLQNPQHWDDIKKECEKFFLFLLRKLVFRKKMDSVTKTVNSEIWIDCLFIMFHPIPEISYMSTPDHRKSATPQPSISHLRTNSRSSSRGSRSHEEYKETIQVHLHDCQHLVRRGIVGLPGGFTKSGNLLLFFQIKQDSRMCLKVIFTSCWNISYQLFRELTRYFI